MLAAWIGIMSPQFIEEVIETQRGRGASQGCTVSQWWGLTWNLGPILSLARSHSTALEVSPPTL